MFESAFGTDFGLADYPAFKESAVFRALCNTPSGYYYNFADCGDKRNGNGDLYLAWFASKTGNKAYYEERRFLQDPSGMSKLSRLGGAALVWLSPVPKLSEVELPTAWKGEGANPIVIFKGADNDPKQFYLGAKGGRGMVNHGNMDGGSFIFELNGVRWSIDPGNQSYHELEKTGFNLWGRCQECERWTLLTKNNYGHSTLTVNDQLHVTEGLATISEFKDGANPEATIDMTPTFAGQLKSAKRRFLKESASAILIEDQIEIIPETKNITWQLITAADVDIVEGGAILKQDGKTLKLSNLSHPELTVSVISLDPPPLKLDRLIPDLKRIEIRIPAYLIENQKTTIRVRLSE
jgi:hypothetical protein